MPKLNNRPRPGLEALEPICGRWASEGRTVASDAEPSIRIVGTDIYEWFADGQFLLHRVHVRFGDQPVEAIELFGEPHDGAITMRSFDNEGAVGVMLATVDDDGVWRFVGDSTRTTLAIKPDGEAMTARWERLTDDTWTHWMDMTFTRLS